MPESKSDDTMVAALLREREGLVARGLKDRVAQVDEQLRLRGHKPPTSKAVEQPATQATDGEGGDEAARQEPPKNPQKTSARQQTRATG